MIYKNDEPYKLSDEDKKNVYSFMGWDYNKKGPQKPLAAIIKFPESSYVVDKKSGRKMRPPRVHIPLEQTEFVPNEGSVKWNYAESPAREVDKMMVYPRKVRPMTGLFSVSIDKIDLLFFLIKSKFRANCPGEERENLASKPLFVIEMREKEAKFKLDMDRIQTQVKSYINGPADIQWSTEKIVKYALAFGIEEAQDLGPNELRAKLLGRLNGEKDGYIRFDQLTNNSVETDIMYLISLAKKNNLITFNNKRKWAYTTKDGKEGEVICGVRPRMSNEESLMEYLKENKFDYDAFETLINNANFVTS